MPKVWPTNSPGLPIPDEGAPGNAAIEPVASSIVAGTGPMHDTPGGGAWSAAQVPAEEEESQDMGEKGDTRSEHEEASVRQTGARGGAVLVKRRSAKQLGKVASLFGAGLDPSVQPAEVIWQFLEDPQSGSAAWLWSILMLSLIALSSGAFVLETHVPLCCGRYDKYWLRIEEVCIAFFTFEYLLRFYACPMTFGTQEHTPAFKLALYAGNYLIAHPDQKWNRMIVKEQVKCRLRFISGLLNLIDLVAIIPFYIELILAAVGGEMDLGLMRIIRLVRIFRLLKLGKYNEGLQLLAKTMAQSVGALGMLCFVLSIVLVIFSAILYFVEKGEWCDANNNFCNHRVPEQENGIQGGGTGWYYNRGQFAGATYQEGCVDASYCRAKSKFQSIPVSMYWSMAAITTTGYGDLVPQTWMGKLFACVVMSLGLLLLALPITVISGNFATIYASQELIKFEQSEGQKARKQMLQQFNPPPSTEVNVLGGEGEDRADSSRYASGAKFGWQISEEDSVLPDRAPSAAWEVVDAGVFSDREANTERRPICTYTPDQAGEEENLGIAWRRGGSDDGSGCRGHERSRDDDFTIYSCTPFQPAGAEAALPQADALTNLQRFRVSGCGFGNPNVQAALSRTSAQASSGRIALGVSEGLPFVSAQDPGASSSQLVTDGSDAEFEMALQTLLKEHQHELMARLEEKLTGVTDDIVDGVLAMCLEADDGLEMSMVGGLAYG